MRKILVTAAVMLLATVPAAAAGFSVFGSYWNTSDVEDTFGGGLGLTFPIGGAGLGLDFRATYYQELSDEPIGNLFDDDEGFFEEESLEVLPLEAGLRYNFDTDGTFNPWVGAGISYMLLDFTRENVEVDDETGFYVVAGSSFGDPEGVNFFAEALYRSTEATVRRDDPDRIRDDVAIDLDGLGVNAGVLWRW